MSLKIKKKIAILALTKGGKSLGAKLAKKIGGDIIATEHGLSKALKSIWGQYQGLIFIMASGIVVRLIAPLLLDKKKDPGVVVVDEKGRFAISLLSGHLGGGNILAEATATILKGQAVITTSSDTLGLTPIDLWARHNNLHHESGSFTSASATLVNSGNIKVYSESTGDLPCDFIKIDRPDKADIIVSNRTNIHKNALVLRQKNLIMGIGCNRGTAAAAIQQAFREACTGNELSPLAIGSMASIDLKNDEAGLLEFCELYNIPITFYNAQQLNQVPGITRSEAVFKATGAYGVAEPAALLAAQTDILLIRKMKWKDVTIAIAQKTTPLTASYQ